MNQTPSLNQFLEEIDPRETIDRKKAAAEVSVVVLLGAVREVKNELSKKDQEELTKILQNEKNFDFEGIYDLFKKTGKEKELIAAADKSIGEVRESYIKTHLEVMTPKKREKVLAKFPSLKQINLER